LTEEIYNDQAIRICASRFHVWCFDGNGTSRLQWIVQGNDALRFGSGSAGGRALEHEYAYGESTAKHAEFLVPALYACLS
jgi:hypothetical protein